MKYKDSLGHLADKDLKHREETFFSSGRDADDG